MSLLSPWRNLQSVMVVTFAVAVAASIFRQLTRPDRADDSLLFSLPMILILAGFFCWPVGRFIASAVSMREEAASRTCPVCRNHEVRPIVSPGAGIFDPTAKYRYASCWSTFWMEDGRTTEILEWRDARPIDSPGIRYLDESPASDEIRFLDEPLNPVR